MSLFVRFTRALFAFGLILADYLSQRWLTKLVAPRRLDPKTGTKRRNRPAWLKARGKRVDERNAQRLLDAMLSLRGVYIKLGQVLSIMGGFLPRVYIKKLSVLQDKVPPHPYSEVEAVFRAQFGKLPTECFARFDSESIAAASLGQVHVAYLQDGSKVAVKILYAGIRDIIRIDMIIVRMAIRVYKWFVPIDSIENAYHSLVDLLARETDYLHEAACMKRMAENFRGQDDILFPSVIDALTTRDILTMTFMEGVKITNFEAFAELGIDRKVVATRLIQAFYKQLFVDRFFHADPHPGNFLVQQGEDGRPRLVVLDFGAISEAKDNIIDGLMEVVQGMFSGDSEKLIEGFLRMGFVAENADRKTLEEIVRSYFGKLMKFKDRSPGAFFKQNPRELAEHFGTPDMDLDDMRDLMKSVHYPDTWFYVERAAVLLFWLSAMIDPTVDGVQVGFPYVLPILMEHNRRAAEARAKAEASRPSRPPPAELGGPGIVVSS
ncbi:MAG: Ubiquinone biosynthesis monooxygenase UbiB [Myxococcaceae bacterium]|nr:Ubiquinone biosynthesis monooxygenase UbiB [Myxococcaceae bacterium]